jgi:hypothetical protein
MNCEFCERDLDIIGVTSVGNKHHFVEHPNCCKYTGKIEFIYSDIQERQDIVEEFPIESTGEIYICGNCIHRMDLKIDTSVPCPFCYLPIIDPEHNLCSCMVKNI